MSSRFRPLSILLATVIVTCTTAWAVPPSPEAKAKFIQDGTWDKVVANLKAFAEAQPPNMLETSRQMHLDKFRAGTATSADAIDTVRLCVILVEFPDFSHSSTSYTAPGVGSVNCLLSATPQMFDSLLFSEQGKDAVYNPTGSMTEYYLEVSYGKYYIQGDVFGWFVAPNSYSYYVGTDDGMSKGGELAHDAVIAADNAGVDFSPYAPPGQTVPGIIVIHAGPGAEEGAYGIWSHRSNMGSVGRDGVYLSGYTMQPEEAYGQAKVAAVGVFCHEYGHVLGCPDLYDVSYNPGSEGLGAWSLMAGGSWNDSGRRPAHFDAYCKYYILGFSTVQLLTDNIRHAEIPQAETSPIVYLLQDNPGGSNPDMFWVENRQKVGFDAALPGSGLIIYHQDAGGSQTNPDRYWIGVVEADNDSSLSHKNSRGDDGDPFPGRSNNRNIHDYTIPSLRTYDKAITQISVLNISDSDSLMYADLGVYYAIPWVLLAGDSLKITDNAPGGNGDGQFTQGETIDIKLEVRNVMKMSYKPVLHLETDNPGVEILQNDQGMGAALNPTFTNKNFTPIQIHIPDDFASSIVTLTLSVVSDSLISSNDHSFRTSFNFKYALGTTQILLVDDDNAQGDQPSYESTLARLRLPYQYWDKKISGSPLYADVSQYPFVLWMTGSYYLPQTPGGTITAEDITYMKALLDNGGNLLLGSLSAPEQLQALDSAFMANYLHANLTGSAGYRAFRGTAGNAVGGDLRYTTRNGALWTEITPTLAPVNEGLAALHLTKQGGTGDYGTCGVTYDGTYRSVFLSFPIEFLDTAQAAGGFAPPDSLITRVLRFFVRGSATPVEEEPTELLPVEFALDQNYPNPFNPTTTISYHIDAGMPTQTTLAVFNVLGQKVATLVDRTESAGNYTVTWQGTDDRGGKVASGVYFYRLSHGAEVESRKMMLLK